MRLQNEDEEEYSSFSVRMPTIILAASAAIFVVLAIVLAVNSANKKKTVYRPAATAADASSDIQTTEERDTLTANDLNFWDMYQDETGATILERETDDNLNRKDELEEREARMREEEEAVAELAAKEAEANLDPATDGKHTMVTHIDGSTEWIAINSSIRQNTYEDTQFQSQNGIIGYYVNGRRTSKTGADISQYTTAIDWDRLSTEVDYVMIRVGARGYDTGKIIADTKFEFGLDEDGRILIGDEMLTPDSSRFWPLDGYEPGKSQPSFDKQLARDYIASHPECSYTLPQEIVDQTIAIYQDGYRRLTGKELE